MSFGEGNLHDEVDRLKVVNGKLCDEINRQERVIEEQRRLIANRDELVRDLLREAWVVQRPTFEQRARELGIEVN